MVVQSKVEPKIEWFKDDKVITETDRVKIITKKDEKDPTKYALALEIIVGFFKRMPTPLDWKALRVLYPKRHNLGVRCREYYGCGPKETYIPYHVYCYTVLKIPVPYIQTWLDC